MIDTIAALSSNSGAAAMKKATGMNKDDFLKLFITQMKNQDPLSPMDSSEFLGQLAQLTQVEQAYNTNANLQSLISQQNANASLAAVSFIGKQVEANGNQFKLTDGADANLAFTLPAATNNVTVLIKDAAGTTVRTIAAGRLASGNGSVSWNGTDNNNNPLAAGIYQFEVSGKAADGSTIAGTPLVSGSVDTVTLEGSTPTLTIGGIEIALADVRAIRR